MIKSKKCRECNKRKSLILFKKDKRRKDGRYGICKKCMHIRHIIRMNTVPEYAAKIKARALKYYHSKRAQIQRKKYRKNNMQSLKKYRKQYYSNNKEKLREKQNKYYSTLSADKKKKLAIHRYNIDLQYFKEMFRRQKGKCLICNKKCRFSSKNKSSILHIDHNHSTKKVRGLLCFSCNAALGLFKDNVKLLNKAIEYLESL